MKTALLPILGAAFCCLVPGAAQAWTDPATNLSFSAALTALGMTTLTNYTFDAQCYPVPVVPVYNATALASSFSAYGIAGTTVINQEWETYTPFGSNNFVFSSNGLALTATLPPSYALFSGSISGTTLTVSGTVQGTIVAGATLNGIGVSSPGLNGAAQTTIGSQIDATHWTVSSSQTVASTTMEAGTVQTGQIATNATFLPGATGANVYAFDVKVQIPNAVGAWPAVWLYAQNGNTTSSSPNKNVGSEIDDFEFYDSEPGYGTTVLTDNLHNPYTGSNVSIGSNIYTLKTGSGNTAGLGSYSNGTDFSLAFHDYQMIWTPDAIYQYLDGLLINAQHFTYYPTGTLNPPQLIVNLAVGTSLPGLPGMQPNSLSEFPISMNLKSIFIYQGN